MSMTPTMSQGRYPALIWWFLAVVATASHLSWATTAFGVVTLFTLPGAAVLSLLRINLVQRPTRIIFSVAMSTTIVMALGIIASAIGPLVGVHRPLDAIPTAIVFGVVTLGLVVAGALTQRDAAGYLLGGTTWRTIVTVGLLGILPVLAALATAHLNNTGDGAQVVAVCVLLIVVLVVSLLLAYRRNIALPTILYFVAFAVMLTTSLRGFGVFGYDIQYEIGVAAHTARDGIFHLANGNAYASMLDITTMPAQILSIFHISVADSLRIVDPAIGALLPVVAFVLIARRTSSLLGGALGAWVVLAALSFARQIPAIAREEVGLVIFGAAIILLASDELSLRTRQVLFVVFGSATAFAHYTTAYLLGMMLIISWVGLAVISLIQKRPGKKIGNLVVIWVVVIISAVTYGWNILLNKTTGAISAQFTSTHGKYGLLSTHGGIIQRWLRAQPTLSASSYTHQMIPQVKELQPWVYPARGSDLFTLKDAPPTTPVHGLVPFLKVPFVIGSVVAAEALLVLLAASVVFALWRTYKRRRLLSTELVLMSLAALVLAILSRTSQSSSQIFNPERMALTVGLVLILPAAELLQWLSERRPWLPKADRLREPRLRGLHLGVIVAVALSALSYWQLGAPLFGGKPSQEVSQGNSSHSDFIISSSEIATATWIADQHRDNCLVSADYYSALVFGNLGPTFSCIVWPRIIPVAVNKDAFVYFGANNTAAGWARGSLLTTNQSSIFAPPFSFFAPSRSLVYSSETTRVYR
jgi:uncharacterized membrane protein